MELAVVTATMELAVVTARPWSWLSSRRPGLVSGHCTAWLISELHSCSMVVITGDLLSVCARSHEPGRVGNKYDWRSRQQEFVRILFVVVVEFVRILFVVVVLWLLYDVDVHCCVVLLHLVRLSGCIPESLLGLGFRSFCPAEV